MAELETTQAYVVMHTGLHIPRAIFLDKELAQDFVDGDQNNKSTIEPCILLTKTKAEDQ